MDIILHVVHWIVYEGSLKQYVNLLIFILDQTSILYLFYEDVIFRLFDTSSDQSCSSVSDMIASILGVDLGLVYYQPHQFYNVSEYVYSLLWKCVRMSLIEIACLRMGTQASNLNINSVNEHALIENCSVKICTYPFGMICLPKQNASIQ